MKTKAISERKTFEPFKINLEITIETRENLINLTKELILLEHDGVCDDNGDGLPLCSELIKELRKVI